MNKYVFTGFETINEFYHCIFESDLDIDAIKKLLSPIVFNVLEDTYVRMDNDTYIFISSYIEMYDLITHDNWMKRHLWKPGKIEQGTDDTYKVVDLLEGLKVEARNLSKE